ncbi:PAS domain-containing protein [Paractinoplanes lichenicola]|uniref:PAS domain-containing protein n=1 Tax=Paractinoplanes lichenicola TaxID=2802976 RepID=A0ABS1W5X4_9ACTN|nr:PAS domain-containing protein [Actinoplanes lichenicola]MBL7262120.1 PAS domain-containing protein [Actinoplanes lichenicola]
MQAEAPTVIADALRATSLAFAEVDRCGIIREWNPAAERLFGWSRAEAVGRALADTLVPEQLRSAHAAAFARRLVSDEFWPGMRVKVPARHRDGSERQVILVINPLPDGFCAFLSDETDQDHAQQELRRSTTLVNAILEHTSAMISAKDLEGRYLFVNAEYERVFQVIAADLVGHRDAEVMPEIVAAAGRRHDEQAIERGEAVTALEELPFGDEIRQYVVTRFPLTDPDGSVYGVCSIGIDDTDRRRAEAALGETERRFRSTVNNVPGMLFQFRIDLDGARSFAFVSEGSREICGFDPQQLLEDADLIVDLVSAEDQQAYETSVAESMLTLEPWRWEGSLNLRNGERRWISGVGRPFRLGDGSTVWDGMLLDRTAERHTEMALEAGRRDLDDLTRRLAVYRFTAIAGPTGDPLLTASFGDPVPVLGTGVPSGDLLGAFGKVLGRADRDRLTEAVRAALSGVTSELECEPEGTAVRRLWLRLRPAEVSGRRVVEGACFDLARP